MKKILIKLGIYGHVYPWYRRIRRPDLERAHLNRVAFYSQLIPPGTLCFDVGANVGEVSESLAAAGMQVIALEPIPSVAEQCRQRCGLSKYNVQVINEAVSHACGEASLYLRRSSSQSSLRLDWEGEIVDKVQVRQTTLAALIEDYGVPGYVKIDVEGHEVAVFDGLDRGIELVSFEYHARELQQTWNCLERLDRLADYVYNYSSRNESRLEMADWLAGDDLVSLLEKKQTDGSLARWGNVYAALRH